MSVEARWVNAEKTAVLVQAIFPWDWQQSNAAKQQLDNLLETVNQPVALIIDLSQAQRVPPNTISNVNLMMLNKHPDVSRVILVGLGSFFQIITNIIIRLYPEFQNILVLTNTLDAALQFIPKSQEAP
ncbi:MAG TPA: hypothetical protein VHO69_03655 [Phototrophicaceae bacterium]|nr:hypothetical protein [Phototrophicaceae bacterium]